MKASISVIWASSGGNAKIVLTLAIPVTMGWLAWRRHDCQDVERARDCLGRVLITLDNRGCLVITTLLSCTLARSTTRRSRLPQGSHLIESPVSPAIVLDVPYCICCYSAFLARRIRFSLPALEASSNMEWTPLWSSLGARVDDFHTTWQK